MKLYQEAKKLGLYVNIHAGTPEDICEDARYAFRYAAKGGGYIMGSSHSLAVGAKLDNIMEMKKVGYAGSLLNDAQGL
ncbi:MAG TPA: hypothetical protein DD727_00040 [Clostridiales bacterium]|nr:hypothetical protein [Clostridiales bacterium]